MTRILVSGSMAYDHIMDYPGLFKDRFLPNKLHNINVSFQLKDHTEHFGGTAGNVAYSLALLGEKPTIISTVGYDFERYGAYLVKLGINTDSLRIDHGDTTSFAYIMTDEADNQIAAFYMGAGGNPYGPDVGATSDSIALIGAGCLDDMRALPDLYRGNSTRFLFDPGQAIAALTADDLRNGITDAEVVFMNDYEFAMVREKTQWSEPEILKVAKVLVITLGGDGARVLTPDGEERVQAVKAIEVRDPTGAGDAYRAGYIKAYIGGKSPTDCAKLGSAVAVFAVESVGTQEHKCSLADIKQRYEQTYGERVTL